jgi:(E)-4-hydroxy-3-methylbut-2-enyl-diphosphate synthase
MAELPIAAPSRLPYVRQRLFPRRRPTRVVQIGDVSVGGDHPIRVQSMTTTFTHDVPGTLDQISALAAAGCEIVRVTVPTLRDAQALPAIRAGMKTRGLTVPLVADIHFSPKLALLAAEHVEKVRINPGNFTDSKRFAQRSYSDEEYAAELERIEAKFTPLVLACKRRGVAMRIGTNHGSLSDRIMNRYGDSPEGMVESALEFVRICQKHDYHELVISMKASNTQVMVQAYRLIAARMTEAGMDYPFHLGVTEAGDGDDARIKSAIGIGSLLHDGIGDTLRVSLTENPVAEVPVGFAIGKRASKLLSRSVQDSTQEDDPCSGYDPYAFTRRKTRRVEQGAAGFALGADQPLRVELCLGRPGGRCEELAEAIEALTREGDRRLEVVSLEIETAADVAALTALRARLLRGGSPPALAGRLAVAVADDTSLRPTLLETLDRVCLADAQGQLSPDRVAEWARVLVTAEDTALLLEANADAPRLDEARRIADLATRASEVGLQGLVVAVRSHASQPVTSWVRSVAVELDARGLDLPLLLVSEQGLLEPATDLGTLLIDGIGDAIRLDGESGDRRAVDVAYGILQGSRRRTTRTEYISCPGCGRTLFELEPVTAQIKALTGHLKGVKIAVMGCIVNGPGEMADADFGYVGWKPGKVNLYVGKECVVREVPEDAAPDRLIELIKEHGRWTEPLTAIA